MLVAFADASAFHCSRRSGISSKRSTTGFPDAAYRFGSGPGDEAAALAAKQRAEEAMADKGASISLAEAQAELARAMAQLRAIERLRKKR